MIRIIASEIKRTPGATRREAELKTEATILSRLGLKIDRLTHQSSGAPFIAGSEDVRISITHSQKWCAIAIGRHVDGAFGIDIESIRRNQIFSVAKRVFSETEIRDAENLSNGFIRAWVAKEAVYKAVGQPGTDFKNDILLAGPDFGTAVCYKSNMQLQLAYMELPHDNLFCIASQCNNFEFETL